MSRNTAPLWGEVLDEFTVLATTSFFRRLEGALVSTSFSDSLTDMAEDRSESLLESETSDTTYRDEEESDISACLPGCGLLEPLLASLPGSNTLAEGFLVRLGRGWGGG